jgi:CheY-like chemotaxis protein
MNIEHSSLEPCLALLVDSDRDSLQMYGEYLRSAAYDVEEAEDGREALAKAISRRPQIIVTETQLPGINGFRLCELLRVDKATLSTPIIVVTADALPADILRAECAGADVVLTKPCRPEHLAAEMRRCMAMSAALRTRAAVVRLHAAETVARSAEHWKRRGGFGNVCRSAGCSNGIQRRRRLKNRRCWCARLATPSSSIRTATSAASATGSRNSGTTTSVPASAADSNIASGLERFDA